MAAATMAAREAPPVDAQQGMDHFCLSIRCGDLAAVRDGLAAVSSRLAWEGLRTVTMEHVTGRADGLVHLRKSRDAREEGEEFWEVVGFSWRPPEGAL